MSATDGVAVACMFEAQWISSFSSVSLRELQLEPHKADTIAT